MKTINTQDFIKAERIYEKYKNNKIDEETIKTAKSKAKFLGNLADQFILVLGMIKDVFAGNFKLTGVELAAFIGAIIYVVSPVDAIPDIIPFVGYLDDLSILGLVLNKYSDALERYKKYKNSNNPNLAYA